jgi:nucleoside phosphorylase/CheY-like chemotaxis protein
MKVLLVEDIASKRERVEAVLLSAVPDCAISYARSFISATTLLSRERFELVVVDLVLPLRDGAGEGDIPRSENGVNILREIFDGCDVKIPNHIICLSEFSDALLQLNDEAQRRLIHCVAYDELDDKWAVSLTEKATYAKKRMDLIATNPDAFDYDVGIVTSYPAVELSAVLDLCNGFIPEFHPLDELHYHTAKWDRREKKLRVVACAAPSMGMTSACVTATKLIQRFRPRYLVMSGIAAGTSKDVTFGDVIVAESCYDYGSGKILEDEDGKRTFVASPQQIPISAKLKALLQNWEANQRQMAEIGKEWSFDGSFKPKMKLGILASGAAVVQSEAIVQEVLSTSRKVAGLEMEAYGVFQAATLSSLPKPEVLVAKSVCDFADRKKGDDHQKLAAFTSARFIYKFFTQEENLSF